MENIYIDTNNCLILLKIFGEDNKVTLDDVLDKLEQKSDDADYLEIQLREKDNIIADLRERLLKYE